MNKLDFNYFMRQIESVMNVNEICFYFDDDPKEEEHYLGCHSEDICSYWVGYCDIEGGADFETVEELVNAPIFNGKSLKERWENVRICSIEGLPLDDWMRCVEHTE